MQKLQVTIPTQVIVVPGETRVCFVSPGRGADYNSQQFFDKYDGKKGVLVGYFSQYIGVLDWQGRKPGTYIERDGLSERFTPVKILFDGETELQTVKLCHLVVISGFEVVDDASPNVDQWYVQELPEPILFYPDDLVCCNEDLLRTPREVQSISFEKDGTVRYALNHTEEEEKSIRAVEREEARERAGRMRLTSHLGFPAMTKQAKDLTLLKRGNIFVLYNGNPDDLEFGSLEEEIAFWSRLDLTVQDALEYKYGRERNRLPTSLELLRSGEADVIYHLENMVPPSYDPKRLRPAFERFRARARHASVAYWEQQTEKDGRLYG